MKKLLYSVLFIASAGLGLAGCSNGDYSANTNAGGLNPLNPVGGIDNTFGWGGTDPMSLELNGEGWKADNVVMVEAPGNDKAWLISGMKFSGDTSVCTILLQKNLKEGNSYFVFYGNTDNTASFATNMRDPNQIYASTLTSLGEIRILENKSTHIKGLFYFLAKNPNTSQYVNIQRGYFKVDKP
ncbi:MAG TPA: DUF6252 family protein [Flavipsychrobacter sp.]|nr:DUF6252 family protein [Flavipsychrobacter sp.]